ncbi:hypothetical protein [Nonomuraea dietziae]|uniref:Uncharacterized protein n=1 Tax=Nonomuraea dietziae TaxID=65515 RepID=A0A7W5VDC2_9ACTN|nr:hypothetical protein [Nonomuraea dietziae]MBB3725597.1 hypothetical protein [Nonomuraea dietziae]
MDVLLTMAIPTGEAAAQGDLVVGAKWRNPDDDLPKDFEANRAENYAKLRKPLDPKRFTAELMEALDAELSALNDALGGKGLPWLKIEERRSHRPFSVNDHAICRSAGPPRPRPDGRPVPRRGADKGTSISGIRRTAWPSAHVRGR